MAAQWYAIRAISGQEKKVKLYIESEIERLKYQSYVLQILIPTEKVYVVKDGKKSIKERSYLPGYILMEVSLTPEVIQAVKDVPGVVGFVGSERGKTPVPLRQAEVNKILGKVEEMKDTVEIAQDPFNIGEEVKVMDGPFSGFTATIDAVLEDKKKLKVIVKIFGRNTPLELNYLQVERI